MHYKKFVLAAVFLYTSAKNAAICRILRHFLGPLLYIGSIVAVFGTTAIGMVFCSVLLWQDIKLLQYICFSDGN